jgi:hypothetical protein
MKIDVHTKATLDSIDKAVKAKSKAVQRMLKVNGMDMVDTIKRNLGLNRSHIESMGIIGHLGQMSTQTRTQDG